MAPYVLFANIHTSKSGVSKQFGKIVSVPVPVDSKELFSKTLMDLPKNSSLATVIRGNNFNKPIYKGEIRADVVCNALNFLKIRNNKVKRKLQENPQIMNTSDIEEGVPCNTSSDYETENDQIVLLPDGITFAPGAKSQPKNFMMLETPYSNVLPTFFSNCQDKLLLKNKFTEGEWVKHMLSNVKKRLSEVPLFAFAASYRLDMKRLFSSYHNSPVGIYDRCSGKFQDEKEYERIQTQLFNLTGSTDYYKKQFFDLVSKSDLLQYPEVFYTFSCSNQWDIILATILSQIGFNIWHSTDERQKLIPIVEDFDNCEHDQYYAHIKHTDTGSYQDLPCPYHPYCWRVPVGLVLSEEEKKNILEKNVYNIQRIFEQRTRSLINNLFQSKSCLPKLSVVHSIKEFGLIGGHTHVHGVGWLESKELKQIFIKLHDNEFIVHSEKYKLIEFVNSILTAELSPNLLAVAFKDLEGDRAENITNLAKSVQVHKCDNNCLMMNDSDGCRYHFPRLPSFQTILCSHLDPGIDEEEAKLIIECSRSVKIQVRQTLRELNALDELCFVGLIDVLIDALGDVDASGRTAEGHFRLKRGIFPDCYDLKFWRKLFIDKGYSHVNLLSVYHMAISTSTWKVDGQLVSQIVLKRSISAVFTTDYNPYCLEAMKSNMAIEVITHTPLNVLNYITKAKDKNNSSLNSFLEKATPSSCRKQILDRVASHRKVSLNEAFYRIDDSLVLSESNLAVVFVNVKFPELRSSVFSKAEKGCINIPGRVFKFAKGNDLISKYSLRLRYDIRH